MRDEPGSADQQGDAIAIDRSLAVLTRAGSGFGIRFLERLAAAGKRPAILGVEHTTMARRWQMARFLARKIGWRDAARYNLRFWTPLALRSVSGGRLHPLPDYSALADTVVASRDINAPEIVLALADPAITRIVLAQSGLIRSAVLSLGKPVLNAHPARLPDFRGVDVVRWALLARSPIEVTLHQVDIGIDTGPVLRRERVAIRPTDTWREVEARAIELSIDMLVRAACADGEAIGAAQSQPARSGRQYYLMPFCTAAELERDWPAIRAQLSGPIEA